MGPIQTFVLLERKEEGENRAYRYRCVYKDAAMMVLCTFNKAGKISVLVTATRMMSFTFERYPPSSFSAGSGEKSFRLSQRLHKPL